ncbi:GIY-YIG nuclease family protein [Glycomyces sp. L485]|uniref:GIY-YIG nuclease family protein n=1 Tax=Glycomyces sp. L485 TaxID=2909235 RepID=UPI001F4B9021|nr:GIY-YIG nuclease family protein [Glycomyces sp. L485]MCH7230013.1 GIY-YIG nuclease family protein [Glycomyces sp. L485]
MSTTLPIGAGFVYVITNPDFAAVKIGTTSTFVEERKKAFQTGAPKKYAVAFRRLALQRKQIEMRAHDLLSDHRSEGGTEWFEVSVDAAIHAIDQAVSEIEGVQAWEHESPVRLSAAHLGGKKTLFLSLREGDMFFLFRKLAMFGPSEPQDMWFAHSNGDQIELRPEPDAEDVDGIAEGDLKALDDPHPFLDEKQEVANLVRNGHEKLIPGDRLVWASYSPDGDVKTVIFDAWEHAQVISRTATPRYKEVESINCLMLMDDPPDEGFRPSAELSRLVRHARDTHQPRILPDLPLFP